MSETYIPLHVHTHYSKLDGLSKPKEIMARCRDYGIPACAVTDHGVLFGAFDFYQTARAAGIKPIIGCELYVSPTTLEDKSAKSARAAAEQLPRLARLAPFCGGRSRVDSGALRRPTNPALPPATSGAFYRRLWQRV